MRLLLELAPRRRTSFPTMEEGCRWPGVVNAAVFERVEFHGEDGTYAAFRAGLLKEPPVQRINGMTLHVAPFSGLNELFCRPRATKRRKTERG